MKFGRNLGSVSSLLCNTIRRMSDGKISNGAAGVKGGEDWEVVQKTFDIILKKLSPSTQQQSPLISFSQPAELLKKFDVRLEDKSNEDLESIASLCEQLVDNSVKTGHPLFLNQLFRGADPYGTAAAMLTTALNTNIHIYEVAPVISIIELEVVRKLNELVGFEHGDGIFVAGGSMANMFGVSVARHNYDPQLKDQGLYNSNKLCIFASEQSHYSVTKAAAFMGFGTESVVKVECDEKGGMKPQDLEKKILTTKAMGGHPLMLWCTSGTTILNGFDPLPELQEIAARNHMWTHVDACIGGALLVSRKHRHLLKGIEKVDSVTWNWHKLLGAPILTSVFLCRHGGRLSETHAASASYLFMKRKFYDTAFDIGDRSIQCGRTADSVKVWLMWKARGRWGLERLVDHAVEASYYVAQQLSLHPQRFKLVLPEPNGTTVCFWVIPPSAKSMEEGSEGWWRAVGAVAEVVKERIVTRSLAMMTYQPLQDKGYPNFFRITLTCHPTVETQHIDDLIQILLDVTHDL